MKSRGRRESVGGEYREDKRRKRSEGCRQEGHTMCEGRHQSVCKHQPIPL